MKYRLALLLVLALSTLTPPGEASASSGDASRLQQVAREGINALRADNGAPRLRGSRSLTRSATAYAGYMLRTGYFGHLSTIRASRRYRSLGEVILMHRGGHGRPRLAVSRWARSAGHRYVLLSTRYRYVGVGKASGNFRGRRVTIWVAQVGRR